MDCPDECKQERMNFKENIRELWERLDSMLPRWFGIMLVSVILALATGVAYVWADVDNKYVSKDTFSISESRTRDDIKELKQEIRQSHREVITAIQELKK